MNKTEVWTAGTRWRMITTFPRSFDVRYSWGSYDQPVSYWIKALGTLKFAMEAAHGSGSDRWYRLSTEAKRLVAVETLRKRLLKAGFERVGVI